MIDVQRYLSAERTNIVRGDGQIVANLLLYLGRVGEFDRVRHAHCTLCADDTQAIGSGRKCDALSQLGSGKILTIALQGS